MRRLHELDGLRALAAISVMVAHFNADGLPSSAIVSAVVAWTQHYSLANLAVAFFYVLSSFILTTLAVHELRDTDGFNRYHFMLRRVFRIWPLYWLVLIVNAVVAVSQISAFGANTESWPWFRDHAWVFALFLGNWSLTLSVAGWHTDRSLPGVAVLWSIAVEEQFYLVYAALAATVLVSGRRMSLMAGLALLIGCLYRGFGTQFMGFAPPTFLEMFAFGSLAAWLLARDQRAGSVLRHPLSAMLSWGSAVVLAAWWNGPWQLTAVVIWIYPLAALVMTLLVAWSVANRDRLLVRWTLASRPLRVLGVLSYGLYVWHPISQGLVKWQLSTTDAATAFMVYLCLTLALAAVSHVLVERPAIRLARRWRQRTDMIERPGHRTELESAGRALSYDRV